MIERGFCPEEMGGLINSSGPQMSGFQNPYGGSGHFGQMYPPNQRPSFAIQELLGLSGSTCRQNVNVNVNTDILDPQSMPSSNLMYFSRELPMYNHCSGGYNPTSAAPMHQEPMSQSYVNVNVNNVRDTLPSHHQGNASSPFCPWRVPDGLSQSGLPPQPHMAGMPTSIARHGDAPTYNYKLSPLSEQDGMLKYLTLSAVV